VGASVYGLFYGTIPAWTYWMKPRELLHRDIRSPNYGWNSEYPNLIQEEEEEEEEEEETEEEEVICFMALF
jgi:hypothetical protein